MITYQEESFKETIEEMLPILAKHYSEVYPYEKEIPFDPDIEKYIGLQAAGMLSLCTVRDEGELIGYNVSFILTHLHSCNSLQALNDFIYVDPNYRGTLVAWELVHFTEEVFRGLGVSLMTLGMKFDKAFAGLCEDAGFSKGELMYIKLLGD